MTILKRSHHRLTRIAVIAGALAFTGPVLLLAQKPANQDKPADKQERGVGTQINDGWITMKIHAQFVTEDALEGSDIDVDTTKGVVTLTGTIPTATGRARAVSIAKTTEGVKSVKDSLKIAAADDAAAGTKEAARGTTGTAKQGRRAVNDGWITSKIYSQFLTEDALENSDIDVDVEAGIVTLSGSVTSEAGRTRAVAIAKGTDGVKNVKDSLKIVKR
jgi:hyperosmotically inducible protein